MLKRRTLLLGSLQLAFVAPAAMGAGNGAQMLQSQMLRSLPVFPWLKVGESTINDVRSPIQQLKTSYGGRLLLKNGDSPETGGTFINLSAAVSGGLLGEPGLSMMTIDFDSAQKVQMVTLWANKGWNSANVGPFISRVNARYASLASPVVITDPESEATDKTILTTWEDLQQKYGYHSRGHTFRDIHNKRAFEKMRTMDGTYDLLQKYIDQ